MNTKNWFAINWYKFPHQEFRIFFNHWKRRGKSDTNSPKNCYFLLLNSLLLPWFYLIRTLEPRSRWGTWQVCHSILEGKLLMHKLPQCCQRMDRPRTWSYKLSSRKNRFSSGSPGLELLLAALKMNRVCGTFRLARSNPCRKHWTFHTRGQQGLKTLLWQSEVEFTF